MLETIFFCFGFKKKKEKVEWYLGDDKLKLNKD